MNLPATAPNAKVHRRRGAVRGRAALKSVRAIPNPRPADRSLKTLKSEDRRPRAEIRRPKPEAERGSVFGLRPSGFGLLSAFDLRPSDLTRLRSSDFRAADHDLPSTGRTLEPPWPAWVPGPQSASDSRGGLAEPIRRAGRRRTIPTPAGKPFSVTNGWFIVLMRRKRLEKLTTWAGSRLIDSRQNLRRRRGTPPLVAVSAAVPIA